VPLPVPELPEVIVIQAALEVAVHAQLLSDAVTLRVFEPPPAVKFWLAGEIVKVHGTVPLEVVAHTWALFADSFPAASKALT